MKLLLVTLFVGFAAAGQLSNTYLPPSSAGSAGGGHGGFLQGPKHSGAGGFGAPKQTFNNFGQPNSFSHGSFGSQSAHSHQQPQYHAPAHHGSSGSGQQIPILRYDNVNNGDGSYHFDYATGNGIMQQEQGHLNNAGTDHEEQVVSGSYSYTGDDGQTYTVHYKADANGFQASGDHLPTPPPIPEAIQKSLAAHHGGGGGSGSYGGGHSGGGGGGGFGGHSGGGGGFGGQYHGAASNTRPKQQYLPPQQPRHSSGSYNANSGYQY